MNILKPDELNEAVANIPPYETSLKKSGVVIVAGDLYRAAGAWVTVRVLRYLGCTLPVQVWYSSMREVEKFRELFAAQGAQCAAPSDGEEGETLIARALVEAPFEQVIYFDADTVPVQNPELLLNSVQYRQAGTLFWPDGTLLGYTHPLWRSLGIEPEVNVMRPARGVMLIDKATCWEALNLALWLNIQASHARRSPFSSTEGFAFAWRKFGTPAAMPHVLPERVPMPGGRCCSEVFYHHDFDGNRFVQFRNGNRWKCFGKNPNVPGFLLEAECMMFVKEFREFRTSATRVPPFNGEDTSADEKLLLSKRWLLKTRAGSVQSRFGSFGIPLKPDVAAGNWSDESPVGIKRPKEGPWRELTFKPDGTFGDCSDSTFAFWRIEQSGHGQRLIICQEDTTPLVGFTLKGCGQVWEGDWIVSGWSTERLHLLPVDSASVVPTILDSESMHGNPGAFPLDRANGTQFALARNAGGDSCRHVFNSSAALADHIASIYACAGAVESGYEITFHTPFHRWFSRVAHPRLKISSLPPSQNAIDLNKSPIEQLRFANDKSSWYSYSIGRNVVPAPVSVDVSLKLRRIDIPRYVVLAPYATLPSGDWPDVHWARLANFLASIGLSSVAVGFPTEDNRLSKTFGTTSTFWALSDSPEWISDMMIGAAAVVGTDSGLIHLAALWGVPTVAIHAQLPPSFLWRNTKVSAVVPDSRCRFCRWQADRGFNAACTTGCSAIATISPEMVFNRLAELLPDGELSRLCDWV